MTARLNPQFKTERRRSRRRWKIKRNGRVDEGETDPDKADTDGDTLPDGLEIDLD